VNYRLFSIFTVVLAVLYANSALGMIKNLGVVGETYPVVEPDVVAELKQQAGNRKRLTDDEFLERMKKYQPADLHHLPRATEDKTFFVDMTYTLEQDLVDGNGKVI